jgi:glycosyltransferase involved in cell wall biosynthesis
MRPIKVLTVLTFYHPHWTGLTAYAKRIAEGLAGRGHGVTVLTTQHAPELAAREEVNGVRVVRLRPIARLSRGLLVPSFPGAVRKLTRAHDVVHFHTPLLEAPLVAAVARLERRAAVMTHQGDLVMPAGFISQSVEKVGTALLTAAGRLATVVVPHSSDYASESAFLRPFATKSAAIYPPVEMPAPDRREVERWRAELGLTDRSVVGFAGRFVEEKGFDYLLRAVPEIIRTNPGAHFVYAGEHQVAYEDFYEKCRPLLDANREHVTFVGLIRDPQRLANFYAMCDVFALPSRTDCFPSVQIEAMLCGAPIVVTDIPGAREPVRRTGMGTIVRPRDPQALADGIRDVLGERSRYVRSREEIHSVFDPVRSIDAYEELIASLAAQRA